MGHLAKARRSLVTFAVMGACGPSLETEPGGVADGGATTTSHGSSESSGGDVGCAGAIVIGEPSLLDERRFGILTTHDVDRDGELDIVGGAGIVGLAAAGFLGGPVLEHTQGSSDGRAGDFDGDGRIDMVFPLYGEMVVYRDVLAGSPERVGTRVGWMEVFDVGDFDLDGRDDLVLQAGDEVGVWRAVGGGVFELDSLIELEHLAEPVAWVRLAPSTPPSLMLRSRFWDIRRYERRSEGGFALAEAFTHHGAFTLDGIDVAGDGREVMLASFITGTEPQRYGVAYLWPSPSGWVDAAYVFEDERAFPYSTLYSLESPKSVDIDGDGSHELVFVTNRTRVADDYQLTVVCASEGVLSLCAAVDVPHEVRSVAVVPAAEGSRIVYATPDEGTWIADVRCEP